MRQLIIAGLGIRDLEQMTIETQKQILAADQVLYLGTEPERHLPQLESWGAKSVRSILELYVDGDVDDHNYSRLFAAVAETAKDYSRTILLVPGHPRIGVTLVQRLVRAKEDFVVTVLPGISSFDTMINDLARDPLEAGSVVVDANRMLLFDLRWPATMDCYLYHVCSVGTRKVHLRDAKKENAWGDMKDHLMKIYPPETEVVLISSSTRPGAECERLTSTLAKIEELLPRVHFGFTLFIQAARPDRINKAFYRLLTGEA